MAASELSLKILTLHTEKRMSDEEIAEEAGTSVGNVKTTLAYYRHHPIDPALIDVPIPKIKKEEIYMKPQESTKQIIELAMAGKTVGEIVEATGCDKKKVENAVSRARKSGGLPSIREQRRHVAEELPTPGTSAFIVTTPAPPMVKMPSGPSPDLSSLHAMIDLAAKLPALKASILAACEEMEKSAQYQLYHVKVIREALSA